MALVPKNINSVWISGTEYGLDISDIAKSGNSFHMRVANDQYPAEDKLKFWRDWILRSFHQGERLQTVLSKDDLDAFRYDDALGVDTCILANWGEAKLTPTLDLSQNVSSATLPMTVSSDGTTLVVGLDDTPYINYWTYAGGWAEADGTTDIDGAVTDLVTAGETIYAIAGGALFSSINYDDWTEVKYTPRNTDGSLGSATSYTTATGVAVVNEEVFVAKSDGVWNQTKSVAISAEPTDVICGYRENIYFGKDCRVYRYDGNGTYLYDQLSTGFNLTALIPYRQTLLIIGYLKVRDGYETQVYYVVSGSENHLYTLGNFSADYRMAAAWGGPNEIYFPNPQRGGVDHYNIDAGGLSCGPVWDSPAIPGYIPFKGLAICEGYLWVARCDASSSTDGVYQADIVNPTSYLTTGWLTSADYDFELYLYSITVGATINYSNEIKLFGNIRIEHKPLLEGEGIKVEYSFDSGDTWETAGISNTPGDEACTFTLDNAAGRRIKIRFTLSGPGTSTPTLTKTVIKGAPFLDVRWNWFLRVLLNKNWGGSDKDLIAAKTIKSGLPFTDDDGQVYTVVIDDLNIRRLPDPTLHFGSADVTLRQI